MFGVNISVLGKSPNLSKLFDDRPIKKAHCMKDLKYLQLYHWVGSIVFRPHKPLPQPNPPEKTKPKVEPTPSLECSGT
jgi:hypothetical protein